MANSSALDVRMDPTLKESAEEILSQLGISSSSAVQMFYHQIVLHRGLPFHLQLPDNRPVAIGGMSRTELDREIKKGIDSLEAGPLYSADDVDQELAKDFGSGMDIKD